MIDSDCKIHYNSMTKRFTLLIPQKHDPIVRNTTNTPLVDYISVDPGIRTFLTCLSNNSSKNSGKLLEIGTNVNTVIKEKLKTIDKIKNTERLSNKKKKKAELKRSKNIIDKVTRRSRIYIGNR